MKKAGWLIGGLAVVVVVAVAVAGAAMSGTPVPTEKIVCENEVIREVTSPDKERRAILFERYCGAGSKDSTNVSILPVAMLLPDEGGNVFVARVSLDAVTMAWHGSHILAVGRPRLPKNSILHADTVVEEIEISYETLD